MIRSIGFVLAALCLLSATAMAAVPTSITVQGRLTDSSGNPLPAGSQTFQFRIFTDTAAGVQDWPDLGAEQQTVSTDASGLWTARVGILLPILDEVFDAQARWLAINVNGTPLPRVRLVTVPYAFSVGTVNQAAGGYIFGRVTIGTTNFSSGTDAFVAGNEHVCGGDYCTIAGGQSHYVTTGSDYSTISGGRDNEMDSAQYSAIPGGRDNIASADYCFAAGRGAQALHRSAFVWADSGATSFVSTGVNQFLIRAAGGVGIGTNAPEGELHVFGGSAGTVSASNSSSVVFEDDASHYISMLAPDASETGIIFGRPADEVMGSIRFNVSTQRKGFHFRTGNNAVTLVLDSLGNLTADGCVVGSNIACPSDVRFKRNIETLPDALDMVEQLRGVRYEWEREKFADREFPPGEQVGLIAQEVREIVPQAVIEQSDGYLAVDYARLVPVLIEGMKEQQRQIDDLRARLNGRTP